MIGQLLIRMTGYVVALAVVLAVCRLRRLPLRETLGLHLPRWRAAVLYSVVFVCLAAGWEWLAGSLGQPPVARWTDTHVAALLLRAFAIVILAPVVEELVFRGLLYTQLNKTPLKAVGAIVLPALLFAAAHFDKPVAVVAYAALAQTFVDGLYFGLVRFKTNSTLLTIALHAGSNAVAVLQRMPWHLK
jgi:uncharacterized protein